MARSRIGRAALEVLEGGGSVLLTGPAGIGKSTIANEVIRGRPAAIGQSLASLNDRDYRPLDHALQLGLHGAPDDVAVAVTAALG